MSLPLEVRTVGLVLFLQVLTLLSVRHCLPPVGYVEPVCSDSVFSAAERRNNSELHNTENKVLFAACAALSSATLDTIFCLSLNRCHTSSLPPADRTSITSRHCEKRAQKATPIEKRREEWAEEDQSDRRFSWSTSIGFFQLFNSLSPVCLAWLLPFQFCSPSLWPGSRRHNCRTTFLSTQWPWRPHGLLAQRSAAHASPSQTAASRAP